MGFFLRNALEAKWLEWKLRSSEDSKTKGFILRNLYVDRSRHSLPNNKVDFKSAISDRGLSSLKLSLPIPYQKILEEAKALKSRFVAHRDGPNQRWKSLAIHGTSAEQTEDYYVYGHKDRKSANYTWTEVADNCPTTKNWLEKHWPYDVLHRVRFMLLEPGGSISPHNDTDGKRGFSAVNVCLNQPFGCAMLMEGYGIVPWRPGDIRLMDIGLNHSVINLSNEDRYHIIIHGYAENLKERFNQLVQGSYTHSRKCHSIKNIW